MPARHSFTRRLGPTAAATAIGKISECMGYARGLPTTCKVVLLCYTPSMNNFWLFVGFLALYFALQLWILPAFGIST